MSLNATAARLDLMRAIAAGEITSNQPWAKGSTRQYRWGHATVTGQCKPLLDAGLIRLGSACGPSIYAIRQVELTDAGRTWLAENDEETM